MRTTVDVEDPILQEVKRLHQKEGRSMGAVISELLAEALSRRRAAPAAKARFRWATRPMKARVDLADKDTLHGALDGDRS